MILYELKNNNAYFFKNQNIEWSWKNKNVPVVWQNIALMWFCGFWNKAYGSHFKRDIRKNSSAYHGPPPGGLKLINKIKDMNSPHEISTMLRKLVIEEETDFEFNHQNSWSKQELEKLLNRHGLKVVTFDKDEIIEKFKLLPKIDELKDFSTYCFAKKT